MTPVVRKHAVLAGAVLGLAAPNVHAQNELRIEDAVKSALTRNERAKIADLNVTVSEANLARARTAFFPTAIVNGTFSWKPDDLVDQTSARAQGSLFKNANSTAATGLAVNQPLLNASAIMLYAQSRQQLMGQVAQSQDDKRLLAFDAARAFFIALSADAVLSAANTRLTTAQANLADTQARADAKIVSTNDVTRAQIDLANAQHEVENDKGNSAVAYIGLAYTINAPIPAKLATPSALLAAGRAPVPSQEQLLRIAIATRPDLASRRHLAFAAHDFAREPLLRLVPVIALTGSFGLSTDETITGHGFYNAESLGATLSWPLFDAGVRYADKRSRDAQATIADLTTDALIRTVNEQVLASVASLQAAQSGLDAAQRARDAAKQSADETAILYKQGLAKAIELVDANDARFLADVSYATAEYSVALAYLALRQAIGLEPIGAEIR